MEYNALQHPLLPQALRRLLGLIAAPGATTLANEFQPVFDLWRNPEFLQLRGGTRFQGAATAAAGGAGVFSGVGIRNPANSGLIAVVDWWSANAAAGQAQMWQRRSDVAAASQISAGTTFGLDSRQFQWFGGGCPILIPTHQSNNIGGAGFVGPYTVAQPSNTPVQMTTVVLAPGSEVALFHATANTALIATLTGYMWPSIQSELTIG